MKTLTTILVIAIACMSFSAMADHLLRAYYGMEDTDNIMRDGSTYGNDLTIGTEWWSANQHPYTPDCHDVGIIGNAFWTRNNDVLNLAGRFESEVTYEQAQSLVFGGTLPDPIHPAFEGYPNGWRGVLTLDLWFLYEDCEYQQAIIQRNLGGDWGLALNNQYFDERPNDPEGFGHLEFQWANEHEAIWWANYEIGTALEQGVWHHAIVSHDRSQREMTYITATIDDVVVADNVPVGGGFHYGYITHHHGYEQLGGYWGLDASPDYYMMKGAIDELYIYYDQVPEPSMLLALLALLGLRKK